MSAEKNRTEALRWLKTASEDLETSEILLRSGRFAHACFHAQQAGEKAVKAIWFMHAADTWGHSVRRLIEELENVDMPAFDALRDLIEDGGRLDRFCIPTRYPNGLPDITPDQAYFQEDAEAAIAIARAFFDRIGSVIKG